MGRRVAEAQQASKQIRIACQVTVIQMTAHGVPDHACSIGSMRAHFGQQRKIPSRQSGSYVWEAPQQELHRSLEPFVRAPMYLAKSLDQDGIR